MVNLPFSMISGGDIAMISPVVRIGEIDETSGPWAYPDGLKLGPDGNIWIESYAMGRLVAVSPEGKFVKAIDQTDAAPYAGKVLKID